MTGWCKSTTASRVKKSDHPVVGDWRPFDTVRVETVTATVKWLHTETGNALTFHTPVCVGMKGVIQKQETQQNRNFAQLPIVVKEHFNLTEASYKAASFEVGLTFDMDSADYSSYMMAYCRLCSNKTNLRKLFWDPFPEKPPDDASIAGLMENWDKLGLTWNYLETCGCLIPNDASESLLINAKLILRPEKHWNSVHNELSGQGSKKKKLHQKALNFLSFPPEVGSSSIDDITITAPVVSSLPKAPPAAAVKPKHRHKRQRNVADMLDPSIHFVGHAPESNIERLALGNALKMIHIGSSTGISDETVLKYHKASHETLREYHELMQPDESPVPRVTLNKDNFHSGVHAIISAYRTLNQSSDNPYRILEKSDCFSVIHDATTYWVKQVNTSILRVISDDGKNHESTFQHEKSVRLPHRRSSL